METAVLHIIPRPSLAWSAFGLILGLYKTTCSVTWILCRGCPSRKVCYALTNTRILHAFISLSCVAIKKSIENIPVSQFLSDPPWVPILSQVNPIHTITSDFLEIRKNFVFPSISGSSAWVLSFRPFDQNLVCTLSSVPCVLPDLLITSSLIWSYCYQTERCIEYILRVRNGVYLQCTQRYIFL